MSQQKKIKGGDSKFHCLIRGVRWDDQFHKDYKYRAEDMDQIIQNQIILANFLEKKMFPYLLDSQKFFPPESYQHGNLFLLNCRRLNSANNL